MNQHPESAKPASSPSGFQICNEPVASGKTEAGPEEELPESYGTDLLYIIAQDPASLFVYWDMNWPRRFAEAELSPRPVHLRTHRVDGEIDSTREINPFRGRCYVEVTTPGAGYYCELGCFAGEEWRALARSAATATPEAGPSENLSTTFATLPLHLSFQRLLDIFATAQSEQGLALSVSELQSASRKDSADKTKDSPSPEVKELIACATSIPEQALSEEQRAKWEEVAKRILAATDLGGSSYT
ncbi:MAG TPA: DUF4912 domain-containing protein [Chthoniobacterales bacterium]